MILIQQLKLFNPAISYLAFGKADGKHLPSHSGFRVGLGRATKPHSQSYASPFWSSMKPARSESAHSRTDGKDLAWKKSHNTHAHTQTDRHRHADTQTQRHRDTETQRDTERPRETRRDTERHSNLLEYIKKIYIYIVTPTLIGRLAAQGTQQLGLKARILGASPAPSSRRGAPCWGGLGFRV